MPATFIGFRKATGENAEDGEAGTVEGEIPENSLEYLTRYVVKFFENGEYSVEGRPGVDPASCRIMTRWLRQSTSYEFFHDHVHSMSQQCIVPASSAILISD